MSEVVEHLVETTVVPGDAIMAGDGPGDLRSEEPLKGGAGATRVELERGSRAASWWSLVVPAQEALRKYDKLIEAAAARYNLDPDMIRTVVWHENSHGYYDAFVPNDSIRPMNVKLSYWKELGLTRESLSYPRMNIEVGAYLLYQVIRRLEDPTPAKIFTLYNNLSADKVNDAGKDYGMTAAYYYRTKPWRHAQNQCMGICR